MLELHIRQLWPTARLGQQRSRVRATATVFGHTCPSGNTVRSGDAMPSRSATLCGPLGRANALRGGRLSRGPTCGRACGPAWRRISRPTWRLARCAVGPERFGPRLVSSLALGVVLALLLGGCIRGGSNKLDKEESRRQSEESRSGVGEATPGLPDDGGGSDEGDAVPGETPPGSGSGEGTKPDGGVPDGEPDRGGVAKRLDPGDVDLRGGALMVRPSSDVRNALPHAIEGYLTADGPAGAESRLLVLYWGGVEECWRLAKVESRETSNEVVVTIYEGSPAGLSPGTSCIEIAVLKVVEVDLTEPLGQRRVLDGAIVSR